MSKKGFSIPEILIVLTIVAIVAVTFITTLKPNNIVFKRLYFNAYHTLSTAIFSIQSDVESKNNKLIEDAENSGGAEPSDSELSVYPNTTEKLCKSLSDPGEGYINILGSIDCAKLSNATSLTQFDGKTEAQLKAMATFVASNGMLFFMTPMDANGDTIVWVDLNGERKPNTAEWKKGKPADIVPFKLSVAGIVQPLGYPTYDTNYLTARVIYSDPDVEQDSQIMSYVGAKASAYGATVYGLDPYSHGDPIVLTNQEVKTLITMPGLDPNCPARNSSEFPSCTVKVEDQR